ncbi:hypothetical protein BDN72DRAFT_772852 [Pluteus cervinus]|uniref:Uncharacterized protein n=1 Tax=Pluteus cervinus TaxID=181527 RepID=A0ACD3AKM6_9AGAR|nr:hypothetical protein BDN72DRAFT_772852 [Pluteus cervinus]
MVLLNWTKISGGAKSALLLSTLFRIASATTLETSQQIFQDTHIQTTPSTCLSKSSTIVDLVDCLDIFTVPPGFYTPESYDLAQPTPEELKGWNRTILNLLDLDVRQGPLNNARVGGWAYNITDECTPVLLDASLKANFDVTTFTDRSTQRPFCVLYEHTIYTSQSSYVRGWGLFAVPLDSDPIFLLGYDYTITQPSSQAIHISAPHPQFDRGTPQQAAAVFGSPKVGAKSLLIAGRIRMAFKEKTGCIPSPKGMNYTKTDPAHDDAQPFFTASLSLYEWQMAQGGCPPSTCAFIQFHGKGPSTCPTDTMFLSTGLGMSSFRRNSSSWYTDSIDRPIKRLQQNLKQVFPDWNATLPSDSTCSLVAANNIVGRFTNGIKPERVCREASNATLATGQFIHIEQAPVARAAEVHEKWIEAIAATFA